MFTLLANSKENKKSKKAAPRKRRTRKVAARRGFRYLANNDLTMQFNTTKDPIYFVFECLEKRSVAQLMNDFIQDSLFEVNNFVSKIAK